jgi:type III secretory pathway component EscS
MTKIYVTILVIKSQTKISNSDVRKQIYNIENWVDLATNVFIIYLYFASGNLTSEDLYLQRVASITLLLMSLNVIFKAACIGVYISMFFSIAKEYFQIFYAFIWLYVSYSVAFDMSFMGYFYSSGFYGAKLLGMMIGELDLNDLIKISEETDQVSRQFADILVCSFIIIVSIVCANMLIGIVVSDIRALKTKAFQTSLEMRIKYVERFELLFPKLLRKYYSFWNSKNWHHPDTWICMQDFLVIEVLTSEEVNLGRLTWGNENYSWNFLELLKDVGRNTRKPVLNNMSANPISKLNNCVDELKFKSKTDQLLRQQFVRALSEALTECLQHE